MPGWLSVENLKWLIATLAVPVTLGIISSQYQRAQTERQENEARLRLYTELLIKREEEDSSVRKGIFDKLLESHLKSGSQDLPAKLVTLDLLALNFNESFDLSALFRQIDRQIGSQPRAHRALAMKQLRRTASGVMERQLALIEAVGASRDATLELDALDRAKSPGPLIDAELSFPDPDPFAPGERQAKRRFKVLAGEHDPANRRVWVLVSTVERQWPFWIDTFDFPLVNFTRISKTERFAVVLKRYEPPFAELTFIYFPSVKDRPFIDEVISNLVQSGQCKGRAHWYWPFGSSSSCSSGPSKHGP